MSLPKNEKRAENDFEDCKKHNVFVDVDKELFKEYVVRAQKDIASAENDIDSGYFYWSTIKAYQAVFFIANALLVKYLGYYSKDHKCIITALLREKIISGKTAKKLDSALERKLLSDMDSLRLERNKAMYGPDAWKRVTEEGAKNALRESKALFEELVGVL